MFYFPNTMIAMIRILLVTEDDNNNTIAFGMDTTGVILAALQAIVTIYMVCLKDDIYIAVVNSLPPYFRGCCCFKDSATNDTVRKAITKKLWAAEGKQISSDPAAVTTKTSSSRICTNINNHATTIIGAETRGSTKLFDDESYLSSLGFNNNNNNNNKTSPSNEEREAVTNESNISVWEEEDVYDDNNNEEGEENKKSIEDDESEPSHHPQQQQPDEEQGGM